MVSGDFRENRVTYTLVVRMERWNAATLSRHSINVGAKTFGIWTFNTFRFKFAPAQFSRRQTLLLFFTRKLFVIPY